MSENQTEKRTLRYDFTSIETHDLSMQLASKTKERVAIEGEKKSVNSQYKAKLDEVTATCNKLSNLVSDGFEHRDIDCEIEFHKPSEGNKRITRKDTGISWIEKMEPWEWNLFNQPEEDNSDDQETSGELEFPNEESLEEETEFPFFEEETPIEEIPKSTKRKK